MHPVDAAILSVYYRIRNFKHYSNDRQQLSWLLSLIHYTLEIFEDSLQLEERMCVESKEQGY